jgi:DNA-directed RNA polymerase subunit F
MDHFYDNFLSALSERYPRKSDVVNALADILPIEKESIYRRLRKNIYFTLEEAMQIAAAWRISLDNIASSIPQKSGPFQYNMVDYLNPQADDYRFFEQFASVMELIANDPNGVVVEISNTLPSILYFGYDNMTRFFAMKWYYKYDIQENPLIFGDIHRPERMRMLEREYAGLVRNVPEVCVIFDSRFIEHLINDIQYFKSVRMIKEEEIALLKEELTEIIDYMENAALKGRFPDTGKKLFFYLSYTWLDAEYLLYKTKDMTLSLIKILELGAITSLDKKVFDKFMNVVQSSKRSSVLLSASNNLQIIEFFEKQRKLVIALQ